MNTVLNLIYKLALLLIFCALLRIIFIHVFKRFYSKEAFSNLTPGTFPESQEFPLLKNYYPTTGYKNVSNDQSSEIWWHYPSFGVGSFKQLTNNIRYPNNPDEGTCTPALFCGAMYKDYQEKSNISSPLPPVKYGPGARVNYYRNKDYLLQYNNKGNILY
jgi:hypothetical protein